MPFEVIGGRVGAEFGYDLLFDETPVRRLSEGNVSVRNLALREADGEVPFFFLPRLYLRDIELDAVDFPAGASALDIDGLTVTIRRDEDGRLRLERLWDEFVESRGVSADPGRRGADFPPFSARLDRVELTNGTFRLIDFSTEPTALVSARLDRLRIEGLREDLSRELPFEAALRMERGGSLDVRDGIVPVPFKLAADIGARDLRLSTFSPYVGLFAAAAVTGGFLDLEINAELDTDGPNPVAAASGNLSVRGFDTAGFPDVDPLVSFTKLKVGPFTALYPEGAIEIETVELREPSAHIVMGPDQTVNLQRVFHAGPGPGQEPVTETPETEPADSPARPDFRVSIPRVIVRDGIVRFEDRSLPAAFLTPVDQLNVSAEGLSSDSLARADFEMNARIDRSATLEAQGEINPLADDLFFDVTIRLEGFDLTTATPYSGRFAGYAIDRGRLSLDLAYRLSNGSLEAENRAVLRNFYLGEGVDPQRIFPASPQVRDDGLRMHLSMQ